MKTATPAERKAAAQPVIQPAGLPADGKWYEHRGGRFYPVARPAEAAPKQEAADSRAAIIQALVALDSATDAQSNPQRRNFPTIHDFGQMRRAADSLRAALAQAEPEPKQDAAP